MCVDEPVDESRACGVEIEGAAFQSEFVLDDCRGAPCPIGGGGRQDEGIDVAGAHSCHVECLLRRFEREAGGASADMSFVNSGACNDPLVAGVEGFGELVIGDDSFRKGHSPSGDDGPLCSGSGCGHVALLPISCSVGAQPGDGLSCRHSFCVDGDVALQDASEG